MTVDPQVLTGYLIQLFESPAFIVDRYNDNQIADATRFIFGVGSGFITAVRYEVKSEELQIRCIRAIATMYTDLFDKVCGDHGTRSDEKFTSDWSVVSAVDSIWGMDCLEGALMFPEKGRHLVAPGLHVLQTVLRECRTSTCQHSALFGIAEIYFMHRGWRGDKMIKNALEGMVNEFLQRTDVPGWLREYARAARKGCAW